MFSLHLLNAGRQWPLLTADNGFNKRIRDRLNLASRHNPRVNVDNEQVLCREEGRGYQQNDKEKKKAHDANAMRYLIWQASSFAIIAFLRRPEQAITTREKIAAQFVSTSSNLTPLQRLMKWSVSERRSRTISPLSEMTVAEWVENRIKDGTLDGLRTAAEVDPTNARLAAHFGGALADHALAKGSDPAEAGQARSEADFHTRRAIKLAPDDDEVKKLRAEVVTLLNLSSHQKKKH
jgi:hypothetical protein